MPLLPSVKAIRNIAIPLRKSSAEVPVMLFTCTGGEGESESSTQLTSAVTV
jgi:hypothetical protein